MMEPQYSDPHFQDNPQHTPRKRLSPEDRDTRDKHIVYLYTEGLLSSGKIAGIYNISDTHVRRILHRFGVPTDKRTASWRTIPCPLCSALMHKRRSEILKMGKRLMCDECKQKLKAAALEKANQKS